MLIEKKDKDINFYDENQDAILVKIKTDLKERVCCDNILRNVVLMTGISAYGQNPLNLFVQGPSSTGKSFVVTETLRYFPENDVIFLGGLSPTALVHDHGKIEEIEGEAFKVVDLSNKILVFLESPRNETIRQLLPILSHDKNEIRYHVTDKNTNGQTETKKAVVRGHPATVFCATVSTILNDLSTRSLIYAPETSEEKIKEVVELQNKTATEPWTLHNSGAGNTEEIKKKILTVKENFCMVEVAIPNIEMIKMDTSSNPRVMRDNKKRIELINSCARLHADQRICIKCGSKNYLLANFFDILVGLALFDEIEISTTTGLAPIVLKFFNDVLKQLKSKNPFNYKQIQEKYYEVYKQPVGIDTLRKSLMDPLEQAGYVIGVPDENDGRRKLFIIARDIPTLETTGKKRLIEIGDVNELKKGKIWLLNALNILDNNKYKYRGFPNNNITDLKSDKNNIYNYLYSPTSIRYFQRLFPELGGLTEAEISGIFENRLNSGILEGLRTEEGLFCTCNQSDNITMEAV